MKLLKENINGQLIDDIKSDRSHVIISKNYLDKRFVYKTYDRFEKVQKAEKVCELLQAGYKVTEIDCITSFGYNFIFTIKDKRTFKDISIKYKF